jgi:hypothetical protein
VRETRRNHAPQVEGEILHGCAEINVRLTPVEDFSELFAKYLFLRHAFTSGRIGTRTS